MIKTAMIRPATVGLIASALSFGVLAGGASAGPGPLESQAVATEIADERGGPLIRVHDRERHKRHKRHHHDDRHDDRHDRRVMVIEREHYVPVYRERVEHHHYVQPVRPYPFDVLSDDVFFIFSFD